MNNYSIGLWILCGLIAIHSLSKMMTRRQTTLIDLLKKHVDIQATWARRRDRALEIAAAAETKEKESSDQKAKVIKIANEITTKAKQAA